MTVTRKTPVRKKAAVKKVATKKRAPAKPGVRKKAAVKRKATLASKAQTPADIGRMGGKVKSDAKTEAARKNGAKGGRPPSPATQVTKAIAQALAKAKGKLPLEHMLDVLNKDTTDELVKLRLMLAEGQITAKDYAFLREKTVQRQDWAAEKSAPYVHPRLQSIEHDTGGSHEEAVAAMYADLDNPVIDDK